MTNYSCKQFKFKYTQYLILGIIAFIFGGVLLFTVRGNPGVSFDSISYLNAAENFRDNATLYTTLYGDRVPLVHFPPLYSIFLALISIILMNCSIQVAAGVLGAITLVVNLFLTGLILNKCRFSSRALYVALIITGISDFFYIIHARVFTESLFLSFMLGGILTISEYLKNNSTKFMYISAVLISCATLTRYVGLSLLITGIVSILLLQNKKTIKSRIKNSILYFIIAFIPLIFWGIRNYLVAGSATNRTLSCHIIGLAHFKQFIRTILYIFIPDSLLNLLKIYIYHHQVITALILFLLIILASYFSWKMINSILKNEFVIIFSEIPQIVKVSSVFVLTYCTFLVLSISFADYTTPLSYRIMLPVFILIFPSSIAYIFDYCNKKSSGLRQYILKFAMLALFISYLFRFFCTITDIYTNGLDFSSRQWQESYIISDVRQLPKSIKVYTNGGAGIYYQTGRITQPIPKKLKNGAINPAYIKNLNILAELFKKNKAIIIYFKNIPSSLLPTVKELSKEFNLKITYEDDLGIILSHDNVYKKTGKQ
jgi:4-amino-4-deoxy-L-arabinose transferase-like glycosyltransferase